MNAHRSKMIRRHLVELEAPRLRKCERKGPASLKSKHDTALRTAAAAITERGRRGSVSAAAQLESCRPRRPWASGVSAALPVAKSGAARLCVPLAGCERSRGSRDVGEVLSARSLAVQPERQETATVRASHSTRASLGTHLASRPVVSRPRLSAAYHRAAQQSLQLASGEAGFKVARYGLGVWLPRIPSASPITFLHTARLWLPVNRPGWPLYPSTSPLSVSGRSCRKLPPQSTFHVFFHRCASWRTPEQATRCRQTRATPGRRSTTRALRSSTCDLLRSSPAGLPRFPSDCLQSVRSTYLSQSSPRMRAQGVIRCPVQRSLAPSKPSPHA